MSPSESEVSTARDDGGVSPGRDERGRRALDWWRSYCGPERGDPAIRARLRRARSTLDALRIAAAADLARRLGAVPDAHPAPDYKVRAALDLSRVLAHVKAHDPRHPMEAAGWKAFPGERKESEAGDIRPLLSGARFNRLLETGDGEEKVLAFTRLVALLDGTVNVDRLARDFLDWNHPTRGDRVRESWAFHYLAAGKAAPPIPSNESEDEAE